jgi:hypothetical protein
MNFFSTLARLAGSRQQENQLSQTFRACFDASPGFRQTVLKTIARACDASVDAQANWHCATQIAGPQGGRLDIHLSSPDRVDQPVFVLESKVGSTLNREQLLRYRSRRDDGTTHHLIAITKHRPDVRIRVLARHKIRSLRWQDIHQALTAKRLRSSIDRFIATAFVEFLEDGDMAYPKRLTLKDLQRASEALRALHRRNSHVAVRQAFQALHSCTGLLHELGNDLREHVSSLATCHRYGPALVTEQWHGHDWNWILISYYFGNGAKYRSMGWGIGFHTVSQRIQWGVWRFRGRDEPEERRYPISDFVSKGMLDGHRLLENLREHAGKWNIQ